MDDALADIFRQHYDIDDPDLVLDLKCNDEFDEDEGELILAEHIVGVGGEGDENNFGEAMDLEEHPLNPLDIPLIAAKVCTYVGVQDLENVRSVNLMWNAEACNILRKTRVIKIANWDTLVGYNNRMGGTLDYPHTSFHFTTKQLSDLRPNIDIFFAKFGARIKSLMFENIDGDHLFRILSSEVPNLESLTLRNLSSSRVLPLQVQEPSSSSSSVRCFKNLKSISFSSPSSQSQAVLKELIAAAPNLEHVSVLKNASGSTTPLPDLDLDLDHDLEPFQLATLLFTFIVNQPEPRNRNRNRNWNHLTCLDFQFRLLEEHIEPFRLKSFPLRSVDVSLHWDINAGSFASFMLALSPTIANLSLAFEQNSYLAESVPAVAHMTHLVSLKLTNFKGSLLFVEDVPHLKNLSLHEIDLSIAFALVLPRPQRGFRKTEHHHRLSSFISSADASNADVVVRIARCFPNLSVLHLDKVTDEGLGVIYRKLPLISELFLANGIFTDSGISGVPPEIRNDLCETATLFEVVPKRCRRDLFLGSLSHLRKARLESPLMTDLAIILGLIDCCQLNYLCLKSDKITDVSMLEIGKMRDNLNHLDVTQCAEISEGGKFILKEKLQGRRLIF